MPERVSRRWRQRWATTQFPNNRSWLKSVCMNTCHLSSSCRNRCASFAWQTSSAGCLSSAIRSTLRISSAKPSSVAIPRCSHYFTSYAFPQLLWLMTRYLVNHHPTRRRWEVLNGKLTKKASDSLAGAWPCTLYLALVTLSSSKGSSNALGNNPKLHWHFKRKAIKTTAPCCSVSQGAAGLHGRTASLHFRYRMTIRFRTTSC